jgi:MFS family permease
MARATTLAGMALDARALITYRYECLRAVASGVVETAGATFLLLVAVRWFTAGTPAKALVAAGTGLGYVISPLLVASVEALGTPVARAASRVSLVGAIALAVAALVPLLPVFVLASLVAGAAFGATSPLLTQVYQDNYPDAQRGRLFSRSVMIRILAAVLFSAAAGYLLSIDIDYFRWLLAMFAAALAFSSWCLWHIPSTPLHVSGIRHPLRAFRHVAEDPMFRTTLVSWMFMGFANLMMLPLRIEYLANPAYHLALRPDAIALLTGVVPNLARLVMSPVWGWLFDRANFFVIRMTLNMGFAIGIVSFFTSDSMTGLALSAVAYGVSVAGGDVAWNLWVTKVAPPERVADYMGVHTFFTGIRGLLAPLAGFALVARWPMTSLGWASAGLIVIGSLVLIPNARRGGLVRRTAGQRR